MSAAAAPAGGDADDETARAYRELYPDPAPRSPRELRPVLIVSCRDQAEADALYAELRARSVRVLALADL